MNSVSCRAAIVLAAALCLVHPAAAFQQDEQQQLENARQILEDFEEEASRLVTEGRAAGGDPTQGFRDPREEIDRGFWEATEEFLRAVGETARDYAERLYERLGEVRSAIGGVVCRVRVDSITVGTEVSVTFEIVDDEDCR